MSSDEDTPSLDKDKCLPHSPTTGGLRHRFRFLRTKVEPAEGHVKVNDLSKLYNINSEKTDLVLPTEDADEVESAIDALEDDDWKKDTTNATTIVSDEEVDSSNHIQVLIYNINERKLIRTVVMLLSNSQSEY